jgi:hypothetical protein
VNRDTHTHRNVAMQTHSDEADALTTNEKQRSMSPHSRAVALPGMDNAHKLLVRSRSLSPTPNGKSMISSREVSHPDATSGSTTAGCDDNKPECSFDSGDVAPQEISMKKEPISNADENRLQSDTCSIITREFSVVTPEVAKVEGEPHQEIDACVGVSPPQLYCHIELDLFDVLVGPVDAIASQGDLREYGEHEFLLERGGILSSASTADKVLSWKSDLLSHPLHKCLQRPDTSAIALQVSGYAIKLAAQ